MTTASPSLNGVHNGDKHVVLNGINTNGHNPLDSPALDSPATPVESRDPPDVKIDTDYHEQESDVRHEPCPVKFIEPTENASVVPQVGTPMDPASIPVDPPHGTPPPPPGELLEDVRMAEEQETGSNGVTEVNGTQEDVEMGPPSTVGGDSAGSLGEPNGLTNGTPTSHTSPNAMDEDTKPPPAKRQRTHTDADKASRAHVSIPSVLVRRYGRANPPFMFVLRPKVRHPSPSVNARSLRGRYACTTSYSNTATSHCDFRRYYGSDSDSDLRLDPVYFQHPSISFLWLDNSTTQEAQGCLALLASCRSRSP
ncbi:hypothetical protein HGRIS_007643 [Hohenbuehelia grisea]|uniref:Uncharacterized protein n=1 Tax=Hohenbuehelia grisea TaxID=104357 RepID=A0ABR3J5F8_9AGAR